MYEVIMNHSVVGVSGRERQIMPDQVPVQIIINRWQILLPNSVKREWFVRCLQQDGINNRDQPLTPNQNLVKGV